jgi:hypothetical protein
VAWVIKHGAASTLKVVQGMKLCLLHFAHGWGCRAVVRTTPFLTFA